MQQTEQLACQSNKQLQTNVKKEERIGIEIWERNKLEKIREWRIIVKYRKFEKIDRGIHGGHKIKKIRDW